MRRLRWLGSRSVDAIVFLGTIIAVIMICGICAAIGGWKW